jgi:antitoxin MazE
VRSRIEKWGDSLAVRLPKPFAEAAGLSEDAAVDLIARDGSVVVTPARRRPRLAALLRKVVAENLHGEIETGVPTGREIC